MALCFHMKNQMITKIGLYTILLGANSLNKEFGPKLKEQMQYCVDHPEEISKLSKVKARVSEVKGVMMENIEKMRLLFDIFGTMQPKKIIDNSSVIEDVDQNDGQTLAYQVLLPLYKICE
ncbi:hypothetical protein Hdeb2414_s0014g00433241 [Helianthus debilis subsp. tardiflorus]